MPTTRVGLLVKEAIRVIEIDEVLLARIASFRVMESRAGILPFDGNLFAGRFDDQVAILKSSRRVVDVSRRRTAFCSSRSFFLLHVSPGRRRFDLPSPQIPGDVAHHHGKPGGNGHLRNPPPICPAPTTPIN
jgi:hypothetical protein